MSWFGEVGVISAPSPRWRELERHAARGLRAEYESWRHAALRAQSQTVAVFSPYRFGAKPVRFNFDLSFNYSPRAYMRPGPLLELQRLNGCR